MSPYERQQRREKWRLVRQLRPKLAKALKAKDDNAIGAVIQEAVNAGLTVRQDQTGWNITGPSLKAITP